MADKTSKTSKTDQLYDLKFRMSVLNDSVIGETGRWIKSTTRDEEKQRVQRALRAFWGAFSYKGRPELNEVALESILELSEQILQIALLANLPIDQLNFKTQVLSIIQQQARTKGAEERTDAPRFDNQTNGNETPKDVEVVQPPKQSKQAGPTQRRTMFED